MKIAKLLLLAGLLAGCAQHSAAPPPPQVELLGSGPLLLPFGLEAGGLRVGGLSGIVREPDGTWLAVVDNEGDTPARVFRLAFEVGEDGVMSRSLQDVPVGAIRLEGLDGRNFDGEGIALEPSGDLLVSSETEPSIRRVSPEGKILGELPVPSLFKKGAGTGIRGNEGFEPLALEPGGNILWTANERPLQQDAPDDKTRSGPVRLLRYERRGEGFVPAAQYVYEVGPIERPGLKFNVRGLVDLLPLPGGDLLALEREYVELRGFKIQIYRVSLDGATDVSGFDGLAGKSYTPVRKTPFFDFAGIGFVPDNIEGMTFGPALPDGSRTLVLVSDNNFLRLQQTQILALRLRL
ncbi:MAG TPA: esterase-like activity of phytase family protein [Thermoanaerobaculia bacterium]|nr:esterase-like activity of phytase family protein [Thermoanaerobaculia bacterium]